MATVSHFAVKWVIQWMQPLAIENAGNLFAAAMPGLFIVRVFRRDCPTGGMDSEGESS